MSTRPDYRRKECGYIVHSADAYIEHIYDQHERAQVSQSEINHAKAGFEVSR